MNGYASRVFGQVSKRIDLAVALWLAVASVAGAQPDAPGRCAPDARDCLSMGKKVVTFVPSPRFETITFYDVRTRSRSAVPAGFEVSPRIGRIVDDPELDAVLIALAPGATPADVASFARAFTSPGLVAVPGSDERGNPVYAAGNVDHLLVNEVIVRFRRGTSEAAIRDALRDGEIVTPPDETTAPLRYVVAFPHVTPREILVISDRLDRRPDVQYAQPNFVIVSQPEAFGRLLNATCAMCPTTTSGTGADPLFAQQWYLKNPGGSGSVAGADINAQSAWLVTKGSADVTIAILDDGIDITHEDLAGKIDSTWNAHTGGTNLALDDKDHHGTAVAGIAAAMTSNPHGIAGIAANVRLMAVRINKWRPDGSHNTPHDIFAAGIYKAAQTAEVIMSSYTFGQEFPEITGAIEYVTEPPLQRVLVFPAGNENLGVGFPAQLAATLPIIAVTATDQTDAFRGFPSGGGLCAWGSNHGPEVTVAAPGDRMLTTDQTGSAGYCSADYTFFDGTSAATPLVAGTAALMLSLDPNLTPLEVRTRIESSAEKFPSMGNDGFDEFFGHGRLDACRALGGANCKRVEVITRPNAPTGVVVQ